MLSKDQTVAKATNGTLLNTTSEITKITGLTHTLLEEKVLSAIRIWNP